ncbi:MAG: hypothetical protein ACYC3X_14310 [Pirellulaceae bacterium]
MSTAVLALTLLSTLTTSAAFEESKSADPVPLDLTNQQDHKLMM